ncbi:hypothetical protein A0H81_05952 [Grifola frondosa]|uniref:Uncharacterized protein n=1 Tax=Grifola frondosa TaxID=5627 RepID=A0A1C7MC92_GRIFR|nr:hypothetical protein A0H81_05952 [Grifola frondosa]
MLYAKDMPERLPPFLLVRQLSRQAVHAMVFGIRAMMSALSGWPFCLGDDLDVEDVLCNGESTVPVVHGGSAIAHGRIPTWNPSQYLPQMRLH